MQAMKGDVVMSLALVVKADIGQMPRAYFQTPAFDLHRVRYRPTPVGQVEDVVLHLINLLRHERNPQPHRIRRPCLPLGGIDATRAAPIRRRVFLFALARRMGTSVEHIDRERTYGHLLPDAADHGRGFLEAFDAREAVGAESFGRGLGAGE
jgi:hypothetical protein